MDEDVLNMSIRKFLKKVGVTSQREIEQALRDAVAKGRATDGGVFKVRVVLSMPEIGLDVPIEGAIETR